MTYEYIEFYDGDVTLPKKLKMSGEIAQGDYKKLYYYLKDNSPRSAFLGLGQAELDSPGGNIKEAMKIATLLKKIYPFVYVNNTCASSCLLLWLSGSQRHIGENGKIGIHRPTFSKEYYEATTLEETKDDYEKVSIEFKNFVLDQGLPLSIYEKLIATNSQSILFLNANDIALIGYFTTLLI